VFGKDERMDFQRLSDVKAPTVDQRRTTYEEVEHLSNPRRLDLAQLNSSELDMFRARNRWRDLLKKHTKDIQQELKHCERAGSFKVEPGTLMKVI
jgi:hypothetical protein